MLPVFVRLIVRPAAVLLPSTARRDVLPDFVRVIV